MGQAGHTLSHYRLVEKIGEGGMGVVWRAEDLVLHRSVAIKVLPHDVARDEARRRMFLEEARSASSVSDAHIVQVYELGQEADLDFIVMEYVEGKPLSALIQGRPMPPGRLAALGLQVARALSRAHRKRLLHRDLKPANILVTGDGDVKVVDFGLATLIEPHDPALASDIATLSAIDDPGASLPFPQGSANRAPAGTLPYMPPEQIEGEEPDPRSDIYSLGVVLYEMCTGRRPYTGATIADLVTEIRRARPKPPHEMVPKLPLELDRIILKALGAARADRYQTMDDLAVDLRRLARDLESGSSPSYDDLNLAGRETRRRAFRTRVIAAVAAALLVTAGLWLIGPWRRAAVNAHTVMILPMEARGQVEGAGYVGRAVAEAIAVNLAQAQGLNVLSVPRDSDVRGLAAQRPSEIAIRSGAGRLVTGAVTRDGHGVHVQVSLVDATRDRLLWGLEKTSEGGDLAELATVFSREIADRLGVRQRAQYEYFRYVGGSPTMAKSPDLAVAVGFNRRHDFTRALEVTDRLVQQFPSELEAHVMRLVTLVDALNTHGTPVDRKSIYKELEVMDHLDPGNPYGAILRDDLPAMSKLLERDDLTPGLRAHVLRTRAALLAEQKHFDEAIVDFANAVRLDPANPFTYIYLAEVLENAGRHAEAVENARKAAAIDPIFEPNLADALYSAGKRDESLAVRKQTCNRSGFQPDCAQYALALRDAGRIPEARQEAERAESLEVDGAGLYKLARFWAVTGEKAHAVRLLHRALDAGYLPDWLSNDKDFDGLRSDHEFRAIVEDVKRRLNASRNGNRYDPS